MGAFIITLLVTRVARKYVGYDVRGSILACLIGIVFMTVVGSFGFANGGSPLQVMPWVALAYGKFCLAFLVVDLANARRIKAHPELAESMNKLSLRPQLSWLPALAIIALGAWISFLPQTVESQAQSSDSGAWKAITSEQGLFTAQFPASPVEESHVEQNPTGRPPIRVTSLSVEQSPASYMIQFMTYQLAHIDPSATVERILESTRDAILKSMNGRVTQQRQFEYEGWPTLEFQSSAPDQGRTIAVHTRVILAGRNHFTLVALDASTANVNRFD